MSRKRAQPGRGGQGSPSIKTSPAKVPAAATPADPAASARLRWIAFFALLLAGGAVLWLAQRPGDVPRSGPGEAPAASATPPATFVGSDRCAGCHATEHAAWRKSQHARAMQHATAETVRGDFGGAKLVYNGVTSTFFARDGRYFVRTDGPDGKLADFEVKYTFGLEPLQQYLVELPGGRLQALSITWDARPKAAGGQRWFHQYPTEKIDFRDELHWTKRAQNWNFMCADCHATDVRKGYDATNETFDTAYAEMSVGCEACHGPGSAHLAWAARKGSDPRKGLTVALDERRGATWAIDPASGKATRSAAHRSDREIEVCAPCHARRAQIAEGYHAGRPFLDHYLPALLTPGLYHADGQQRDEVFIWGSWLQSRMHRAGVTCSDCHDPHTQKLRAEGNAVCSQCHAAATYDTAAHHRHAPGSPGAQCAECHMPRTTYMGIDGRRDHSVRVPRPDQSVALGVPNACNACHLDRAPAWAAEVVRGWLGRDAAGFQSFATTFSDADAQHGTAGPALAIVATDPAQPPIVRAAALERLARTGDPRTARVAQKAAGDVEPLLRLAAAQAANGLAEADRTRVAGRLLGDPYRAVRIEAARAAAGRQGGLPPDQRAAWERAAEELVATQTYNADRPEAHLALGSFRARLGEHEAAQSAFATARRLDPAFVPAYVNAADALAAQGREQEAEAMLRAGLAAVPDDASLHHALGLSLVRQRQMSAALASIARAVKLAPDEPRYAYVYAVALHETQRNGEAIAVLEQATRRWPDHRDMLFALATMQRDAGRQDAARSTAERLVRAYPDDRDAASLRAELQ